MSLQRNWTKYRVKETSHEIVNDLLRRMEMEEIGKSPKKTSRPKLLGINKDTKDAFFSEKGIGYTSFEKFVSSVKEFRPDFDLLQHVDVFDTNPAKDAVNTSAEIASSQSSGQSEGPGTVDFGRHYHLTSRFPLKWLVLGAIAIVLVSSGYLAISNRPFAEQAEDTQYPSSSSPNAVSPTSVEIPSRTLSALPIRLTDQSLPYTWKQPEPEFDIDWDIRVGRGEEVKGLDEYEEPLINGDLLKIKLYSKLPVYFNLYWLDAEGAVFCIYPESHSQKNLSTTLELPPIPDQSFVLSGAEGLHAIVAVAFQVDISIDVKPIPLPQPANLIPFEQGAAYFDETGMVDRGHRGPPIAASKTAKMNDPVGVLSTLTKTKWDQRAAAVRAVCFVTTNR